MNIAKGIKRESEVTTKVRLLELTSRLDAFLIKRRNMVLKRLDVHHNFLRDRNYKVQIFGLFLFSLMIYNYQGGRDIMNKLFTEKKLSWKFIILFSIIVGLLVGGLNCIPIFTNTSLTDIAVVFDMWIVLAIFIIMNQKNAKDAVLKCFIFFLISQPLIYLSKILVNVVFYDENFIENFNLYFRNYYIGAGWFRWTLLTIPGSFIAYQIKKDNILSGIILSVATCYLVVVGTKGLINTFVNVFPYHLLIIIFQNTSSMF